MSADADAVTPPTTVHTTVPTMPVVTPPEPPWLALPANVSDRLRPLTADLVEAIIQAVPQLVPAYARPIEGNFGRGLRTGVAAALDRFFELPGTRLPALSEESRQLVAGLGRGEFRQGRSMDALLGAYRMGARVTFREVSRRSMGEGFGPTVVVDLGESIMAYIDELSAVSAEAYAFEQSERAGAVDRRRAELLELLLLGRADDTALRQAASLADWAVPAQLAVVTLPLERAQGVRQRLGPGVIVIERETDAVALVPDRPTLRADLERALAGRSASIGPAGSLEQVAQSLRLAVLAATMLPPRVGPGEPPVWADEHLTEVMLAAEPAAVEELARRRLAPLAGLAEGQREKLEETLLAWLRHWGQRAPIAEELGIHAQTVGYRVLQLRELFGDDLKDPRIRFELEIALRRGRRIQSV